MQTRSLLQEELDKLRQELSLMTAMVEENLGKSIAILRTGDAELADEVKRTGRIIDEMQLRIEDMALALIATQQPVASDLRELITVFKFTSNLERIDDHAIHLTRAAVKLSVRPPLRSMARIERMSETGQEMLKAAFSAYLAQDKEEARKAAAMDEKIDEEHKALTEEVLAFIKENPKLVKASARVLRLSGNLERLGDHITNICEGIIFMLEGNHEELNPVRLNRRKDGI
jgi:phosphate transport system protein